MYNMYGIILILHGGAYKYVLYFECVGVGFNKLCFFPLLFRCVKWDFAHMILFC